MQPTPESIELMQNIDKLIEESDIPTKHVFFALAALLTTYGNETHMTKDWMMELIGHAFATDKIEQLRDMQ